MIFIDTGWLVALVNTDDSLHARAQSWLQEVRGPLMTTEQVLLETYNGLSRRESRARCHLIIPPLLAALKVQIITSAESDVFSRGLQLHADRPDKDWSLTDCISFFVMEDRGITQALAFDHHFIQAGFDALLRREP